ncbi:hypothetical protein PHMEG_00015954 [Phytophthora megakarya]|uniref:Avirulence (Avh) protein n=1 Tax=Phytophthora megakarya TaxID=4795 RepID=A0A225W2J3_9STRA|nr:hypothetical protein PHMEG_00015954 [Phytophthora megakarya]
METFTKRFGDIGMAKMFHTSKQTDWGGGTFEKEVRKLITRLESAQLKMWLDSGETTDDVFKLFKLDDKANRNYFKDKVLLTTWASYVNAFIGKNPGQKDELFSALKLRFEDRPLNEILNIAKTFPSIESAANKIQTDKIENYLVNNVSPKRVFELLGLTKDRKHILDSPHFQSWMQYVEAYNTKNPSKQESWFAPLLATYNVERMFVKAMQNPSTMKIDKMMETEWMKHSLNKKYSPKDTFVHLGLKAVGDNALISPAFKTWTQYLDAFNVRYPEQKVTMIDGLTANFTYQGLLWAFQTAKKDQTNEKLVTTLQENLIDKWVTLKEKPEDLKRMLHHIEIGEEMIQRYMKKISSLGEDILSAKLESWTKNLAAKLESAHLKMWLDSGKTTNDVVELLKLDDEANTNIFAI